MLGWSNSKNGLLFLIFSTAVSSFVQASDTWKSDSLFLMGYQSFINHQYAQCADNFFSSIENGIAQESRARLYLASCQTKLGSRGPAAYHLAQINEDDLNNREKGEYRRLSTLLKSQLDETGLQAWLTPFFGVLMYDTKSTSLAATKTNAPISAGVFYGLQSSFIKDSWIISMGGQVMSFPQTDGTNSTQITGLLGVDKQLGSSFSLWAKGIYIYSSNTSLQSEVIGGTGFQWYWSPAVKVKVDYFYSSYPYFSFGPMTLSQISGSLTWNFVQSEKESWSLELGSQSILPRAPATDDSITGFSLRQFYQRTSLGLEMKKGLFSLSAGGWLGTEAFGVRGGGYSIYAALEEHRYGWNAGFKAFPEKNWGIQFLFLQEKVYVSRLESMTNTIYGSLIFKL